MRVLGSKALADAVVVDLYGSHQPIGRALAHLDPAAPGQEGRIILHPVNQGEHLLCAVRKHRFAGAFATPRAVSSQALAQVDLD